MLAVANLASYFGKHVFSNSVNAEMRNLTAFAVAELSCNSDVMQMLTDEDGLEAVLYLT
jgi:hypothetical protein